jgi:hypothetical protein
MRVTRTRFTTGFLLIPVLVVFLVMASATAFGKPNPSAAQYQYKVTICHKTKSAKNPQVTITVSSRALKAHLKHGDTLGPCVAPSAAPTSEQASLGNGNGKGKAKGKSK